jgi:hypothetical protein
MIELFLGHGKTQLIAIETRLQITGLRVITFRAYPIASAP